MLVNDLDANAVVFGSLSAVFDVHGAAGITRQEIDDVTPKAMHATHGT